METNLNQNLTTRPSQRRLVRALVVSIILILLVLGGLVVTYKLKEKVGGKLHASSEYQAVFLTTGQVYFGKLELEHNVVALSDVYYLQVSGTNGTTTPQQPASGSTSTTDPNVKLVKLGSELHGPEDKMFITKDNVLFWENLKSDSKVVQAIKNAK